jgi:hypothetical protein
MAIFNVLVAFIETNIMFFDWQIYYATADLLTAVGNAEW